MGDNNSVYSKAESDAHHRRGYQACDPCRKRKVKCDLGSVDNPRPPPCVRCRRESKRCEFSATRRKRKTSDAEEDELEAAAILHRDKRMMIGEVAKNESQGPPFAPSDTPQFDREAVLAQQRWSEAPSAPHALHAPHAPPAPPTPRYMPSVPTTRPPIYPGIERPAPPSYGGPPMMNRTAVELLSPAITNTHDALHLLSEAAGRTEDLNRQSLENRLAARQSVSSFNSGPSPLPQGSSPRSLGGSFVRTPRSGMSMGGSTYYPGGASGPVDPQIADPGPQRESPVNNPPPEPTYLDAIRAWSRLRFVRAGWLTVEEGMDYVAYYYEHLAPMSPVVIPDFSHPSTHRTLLTDEPVLAVTILTIASRHLKPKGEGANTRAFYIHDRLWAYLRSMVERLFWGQEKFDAGTSGIGRSRSLDSSSSTSSKGSMGGQLRSLGTIEAMLLLTEWHPRNLHFPPGDDENSLLDTDPQIYSQADHQDNDGENNSKGSEGRVAFQKWLEPAWRSDRMSWMLLSTAQALAFELGVFDPKGDAKAANESLSEQTRKRRLRRLILVFITHSSGRLGIPSMLPLPQWGQDITPTSADANDADANLDRMQDCWISISKIVYQANHLLFASSDQTMDLIRSGRYREQIDRFQPYLRDFQQQLDSVTLSPAMRSVLLIELEYTRLYINSLALQAVVDRWTTMSNESTQTHNQTQNGQPGSGPSNSSSSWFQTLNELYRVNEHYIQEVIDSSRKILQTVLEGLVPEGRLRHAPIRTFFRILSGMIFILKTFTLGAREDDVRVSLDLQDRTVEALRNYVVDDVHLSNTVARLLELLTSSIRTRFLRFAPHDRGADGDGHDRTSVSGSRPHSPSRDHSTTRREGPNTPWSANQGHDTTSGGSGLGYVDTPGTGPPMVSGNDPLANIPAQPINSSNLNVSFMPPPPSVYHNYYESSSTFPANDMDRSSPNHVPSSQPMGDSHHSTSGALPDWFALPLDQFFNSSTGIVDQGLGGTGPMLGEFDMLEVLLNEGYDGNTNGEGETGAGLSSQYL
ncbi:transcriptional regulator family: Fungal Specific TF [Penicillium roqueforti]|nr:transcriptional regulator family: Fungal Specific TF [Penicillium roqueforti]KAF9253252.1 transcriptional regulator family: Fungal Specific TF [Penicillium roqueforti]KAI1838769.1 transcriptional regulator family: Fungal Specific TF [Penicillium roqueforti]KAI2680343.1 transcriptional regulator family: Fungal Specific TF [Penicillium roqueforti]KAI2691268.1 transcriptional regulator family: Fungal Specific TF [Penicillium roqueforti]KAI2706737.1 transcriptional regulator family: Fungal Spec